MKAYYFERIENNRYDRTHSVSRSVNINKVFIIIAMFSVIAIITLFAAKRITYAKSSDINMNKKYTSITIYCGDTVETIAAKNYGIGYSSENSYINEICKINNIDRYADLIPGNFLILPYYEVCTP